MDHNGDSGWIKDLPAGWIEGRVAGQRLRALLESHLAADDLAPWLGEFCVAEYQRVIGGTEAEARHSIKLEDHLSAVFQRAILTGAFSASAFDGHHFKALPKAAFAHLSVTRNALQLGPMDLDPLWPAEWWPWSSKHWAVPKAEFEAWMASPEPLSLTDLPPDMASAYDGSVVPLTFREPTARARVSLCEAVSWIAFGIALEPMQFEMALHWERLENGDIQAVQRKVTQAVADLVAAGADSRVAFTGRHVASHWEKGATNDVIAPLKLEDYMAFIIGRDDLYYGEGLHRTYRSKNDTQLHSSERRDLFTDVKVSRDDLMAQFPRKPSGKPTDNGSPYGPIYWADFGADAIPALQRHFEAATRDEWWTWPEAIAWVGSRDANHIATLRHWATLFLWEGDRDIILGGQHQIAGKHCPSPRETEADLLAAIERGAVATIGRRDHDAPAGPLEKERWRGGAVVYSCGTAQLVSAKSKLTPWAFDIAVRRADLVDTFPAEMQSAIAAGGKVPANRQLDHDEILGRAASMLAEQPGISKGSAAASIVADLPKNPRTKKPRDTRHIERIIAHLWEGGVSKSPQ